MVSGQENARGNEVWGRPLSGEPVGEPAEPWGMGDCNKFRICDEYCVRRSRPFGKLRDLSPG